MKIDDRIPGPLAPGQVGPATPTARPPGAPPAAGAGAERPAAGAAPAATVELSIRALELHSALRAVRAAADVRPEVVDDVRRRLADGRYRLDAEATARGILDRRA